MRLALFLCCLCSTAYTLTVGLIVAVKPELGDLPAQFTTSTQTVRGGRTYIRGQLHGLDTALVMCRPGKVAAAIAATELITQEKVDILLFLGMAGALDPRLHIGDIVVAETLIHHDLDPSPFSPKFSIPFQNITYLPTDPKLTALAGQAAAGHPLYRGLIATGDQIIKSNEQRQALRALLPETLAVEMEGAAIAQVAYEYNVPCAIIRYISDDANEATREQAFAFAKETSGLYTTEIVRNLFASLQNDQCKTTEYQHLTQ